MAGDIEFLGQSEPRDESSAPESTRARDPHSPGGRRVLAALIVVGLLFAGLLVGRAVTSGGRHAPPKPARMYPLAACNTSAVGSVTTPNTEQSSGVRITLDNGGQTAGPLVCFHQPSMCLASSDGHTECDTSSAVPAAVFVAVRRHFPAARLLQTRTETLKDNGRLWFRYLLFQLPVDVQLGVEVVQGHADDQPSGEWDDGGGLFGRAVVDHGTTQTLVTVDSPSGADSVLSAQYALAREVGLAAT